MDTKIQEVKPDPIIEYLKRHKRERKQAAMELAVRAEDAFRRFGWHDSNDIERLENEIAILIEAADLLTQWAREKVIKQQARRLQKSYGADE